MSVKEFYDFLQTDIVTYVIQIITIIFGVLIGILLVAKNTRQTFDKATKRLEKSSEDAEKNNNALSNNTESVNALTTICKNTNENVEKLTLYYEDKIDKLVKDFNDREERIIAEVKELVKQINPVIKLPSAFAEMVSSTPEQVRNGTARKVCDILGVNDDNIQKSHDENVVKENETLSKN